MTLGDGLLLFLFTIDRRSVVTAQQSFAFLPVFEAVPGDRRRPDTRIAKAAPFRATRMIAPVVDDAGRCEAGQVACWRFLGHAIRPPAAAR